ncbi:MAG: type II toxin-antitoxin system VapC family toxin [Treponema sp.]|nr:type II toxin-antitoxin system VapC family toxin [Treponema sp.]
MNYILDTNILVYSLCNPSELSKEARRIVTSERNLSVSIVSFWEIAIKQTLGKLNIKSTIPQIEKICFDRDIKILPISSAEIEGIKELPPIHRDPFDRLIISQAMQNNLCLVTSDTIIPKYDVKTLW